ncbi:hypothetical protein GCM10023346_35480 [Arthrobacter gyeryongensis]|uniref:Carbohydrate kinase PfkB domain-containing protein n=1 Tax=Arthrobacter gyeryongensis TaxID=1650592 RepID=A0ABP9SM08_9MICC
MGPAVGVVIGPKNDIYCESVGLPHDNWQPCALGSLDDSPATKTSVVNSVGAGDAFCAALVLALASGLDEESSLAAACAVGAAAVGSELSQPGFERLEHYLPN